jgi:hypothetical protein
MTMQTKGLAGSAMNLPTPTKGMVETIVGLASRADLNGLYGCVLGPQQPSGRVPVRVRSADGAFHEILSKLENLALAPTADAIRDEVLCNPELLAMILERLSWECVGVMSGVAKAWAVALRGLPRHWRLTELVGPPPAGVAPLDQFREALMLTNEANGRPPGLGFLQRTNAVLLQLYRHQAEGGYHERRIRAMVDRCGWAEADAAVVELCLLRVSMGIGLAVRERRTVAAAICHGAHASIALMGLQMASPAPDFFMAARGPPELVMHRGLLRNRAFGRGVRATCQRRRRGRRCHAVRAASPV